MRNRLAGNGVSPVAAVSENKDIGMAWLRGERLPAERGVGEAEAVVAQLEAAERAHAFPAAQGGLL